MNLGAGAVYEPCIDDGLVFYCTAPQGLISCDHGGRYHNSPTAEVELVSTSRHYWGDYLKHQVDAQFYARCVTVAPSLQPSAPASQPASQPAIAAEQLLLLLPHRMQDLHEVMVSGDQTRSYDEWFAAEPEAAAAYTAAQHNGSLATACAPQCMNHHTHAHLPCVPGRGGVCCGAHSSPRRRMC
jgi:hypothetical protein